MSDWWRSAVIYQVYPRSFADSDGDGTGDLRGITARLPYLAGLGVDAVWLSPFYPSPQEDGGYDVSDFTGVDPMFGTLADFDAMVARAHELGLRVVLDLVPNHTSRQHPWFAESRSSRGAARRDWYIWRDPAPGGGPPNNWRAFTGGSGWTFDESTGQYYLHSFFAAQPDLNWRNPKVREAMADVMRFWLDRGADGFRVDMVDYLLKDAEFRDEPLDADGGFDWPHAIRQLNQPEVMDVMRGLRQVTDAYPDRVLLGEIEYRLPVSRMARYYDALHLPFNFWLLFLPWRAAELIGFIQSYDAALPAAAWPNWVLGNHDVPRPVTRLGSARSRAAMVLLLTLRGTPVLYYGDELGMENVPVPPEQVQDPWTEPGGGRDPARTPMRWTPGPNAGFCPPEVAPWLPVGDSSVLNVETEETDPGSMLSLTKAVLAVRRSFALGNQRLMDGPDGVVVYLRDERFMVAVNTVSGPAELDVPGGVVRVSTAGRSGPVDGRLVLDPDEACVVELVPA